MNRRAIAFLVQQQVVEEAIGFVGRMDSRQNATAALAAIGTAEGLLDGWTVPGGTLPNQVQGIAKGGIAAFGQMADPTAVATLLINRVESSKSPEMVR